MFVKEMICPNGASVHAWRLEEEAPQLLTLCREAGIACEDLAELPVKRQREKAAERLLLCRAIGHPVDLVYTEQGAPSIVGFDMNLSITHTQRLVAIALDEKRVIGLDAEPEERSQVLRVRDKFLNASERQFIDPDNLAAHIIAWTAKEAVIKGERNSAIDWTEGICLEPFILPGPFIQEITLAARCGDRLYNLITRRVEGHFMTLAALAEP